MQQAMLRLDQLIFGDRARQSYDNINDLAGSIAANGLIQPITVVPADGDKYRLITGGRRYKAMSLLDDYTSGKKLIPVLIRTDIDSADMLTIELEENTCRLQMLWHEEVEAITKLHKHCIELYGVKRSDGSGWSAKDTAARLGKSEATISRKLELGYAITRLPQLKSAQTEDRARAMLKSLLQEVTRGDALKKANVEISKPVESPILVRSQPESNDQVDETIQDLIDCYHVGDFRDLCDHLPPVDFVEIDSPYAIDLKSVRKGTSKGTILDTTSDYTEWSIDEYITNMTDLARIVSSKLLKNGWYICWCSLSALELTREIFAEAGLDSVGLPAIWRKYIGQSNAPDYRLASLYEVFFYGFHKGESPRLAKARGNVFDYDGVPPSRRIHPTERPVEMMVDILSTFCLTNSMIWVPFLGSGNTILAASNLRCQAIGSDLSEAYKKKYAYRLLNMKRPFSSKGE